MKHKSFFFLIPSILSLLLSINFFWTKPLVPGFDAPFYLNEIRKFAHGFPNLFSYGYIDRYLTIAFPGTLSRFFGIDPVISYRIAATLIFLAISLVLFKLFKNIFKNEPAAVALSSALVISPFLLNYLLLFANFSAFLILFLFFAIETGKDFKYKNIVLGIIFGLLFYVHNFSSVSFSLIIGTYYLLKIISEKNIKTLKKAAIIFAIAALIGSFAISKYIKINPGQGQATAVIAPGAPMTSGIAKELILSAIPVHAGKFWLLYFAVFTLVTIIFFRKELFKDKKALIFPAAIFIPSLILTLQPLYHLNYLPERFVTLVILSSYFFYAAIISLPKFKKYLPVLAAMPLLLNYLSADSLILNKGYRSFSDSEITFYKDIKPIMQKEGSIIFTSSAHSYWASYFLEGFAVGAGEYSVSCGTLTEKGYLGDINFTFAKLLSDKDIKDAESRLDFLKTLLPGKTIYILVDTSLSCGDGKILSSMPEVTQIYNQDNWYLYKAE